MALRSFRAGRKIMLRRSKKNCSLFLLLFSLFAPLAWGDCEVSWPNDVVLDHVRQTKKVSPVGWKDDGFYYLFLMNGWEVYLNLESQGGLSGEPIYSGEVYQIRGDKIRSQCLNEVDLGIYRFIAQPDKKTFTISGSSGCNDHSPEECEHVREKYHYVWNGLAFYTTKDIALSKSNLKKLLTAIRRKEQKTISALIKQSLFYPALSRDDLDDRKEESYCEFEKSKAATFAVMNFEVRETLKALKSNEDPVRLFGSFFEIANAVFNIYDSQGSQRKIFPEDRAYTQLINDIGFAYQQLWKQLLKIKPVQNDTDNADPLSRAFENARSWLNSARKRDPQRAVVYLNLSDLFRVWNEKGFPDVKDEPQALLKSQCYGSKYVELMAQTRRGDKIPPKLTKFLGGQVGIASRPVCKTFFL